MLTNNSTCHTKPHCSTVQRSRYIENHLTCHRKRLPITILRGKPSEFLPDSITANSPSRGHCLARCSVACLSGRRGKTAPVIQADMAQRLASGRPCWKVNLRLVRRPRREPDYLYEVGVKDGRVAAADACQRTRRAPSGLRRPKKQSQKTRT